MTKPRNRTLEVDTDSPNDGRPRQARIWLDLDSYYWQHHLDALKEEPPDLDRQFVRAMKAILWGALYIEARINSRCRDVVEKLVKEKSPARTISQLVRLSRTQEKAKFLGEYYETSKKDLKVIQKSLRGVFGVRDKLVHADPEPVEFQTPPNLDLLKPWTLFRDAPTDAFFEMLTGPQFEVLKADITRIHKWLMFLPDKRLTQGTTKGVSTSL